MPAIVNYLYWDARPDFDRLMRVGAVLRMAQIDALEGRALSSRREALADVRRAEAAVRRAEKPLA